jgi:uncharacterized protein
MHYVIDGYNLMFRIIRAGDELSIQRKQLIENLNTKARVLGLNITLVFDAQYRLGEASRGHYDFLEILFTGEGETADEYILKDLKNASKPSHETVVTSDKKLAWLSRRNLAKTETIEHFLEWLNKRYKNKLRQTKQVQTKTSEANTIPKRSPPTINVEAIPNAEQKPEECFDFYLGIFENAFDQIQLEKAEKKAKKKEKKISLKKSRDSRNK